MSDNYGLRREDLILLLDKCQLGTRTSTNSAILADYILTCLDALESTLWARKHLSPQDRQ